MKKNNALFTLLFISFAACNSFNIFEKEGAYIEKRIELNGVSAVENLNTFRITLIQDDEEFILLKGGENLISKTEVIVNNELAKINHSYSNNARNFDLITAEIHLKDIKKLKCSAPAHISSNNQLIGKHLDIVIISEAELVEMNLNLNYESLKFHSYGNSNGGFEFKGTCPNAHYILNGAINIQADNLHSCHTTLAQNGIGEAHVWVEETLTAHIYSSGDVFYKGNPKVRVNRIQVNNQSPTARVIPQ